MLIFKDGKQISETHSKVYDEENTVFFANISDKNDMLQKLHFNIPEKTRYSTTCFEAYKDFDCISFMIPNAANLEADPDNIEMYFASNRLLVLSKESIVIKSLIGEMQKNPDEYEKLENVFYKAFYLIIDQHVSCLDELEDVIEDLEDLVMEDAQANYVKTITDLRKKLLVLKKYYESLDAVMEAVEDNANDRLSSRMVKLLHIQSNKAHRMYQSTLHLRDYLTQVREAYQAQLDIQMNNVMKVLTSLTAIFMPLTLIVGWYGMNLAMPEYNSLYTYPIVVVVSIAIVTGCIIYFRKHKWF